MHLAHQPVPLPLQQLASPLLLLLLLLNHALYCLLHHRRV
jgi:hypothetical protein